MLIEPLQFWSCIAERTHNLHNDSAVTLTRCRACKSKLSISNVHRDDNLCADELTLTYGTRTEAKREQYPTQPCGP